MDFCENLTTKKCSAKIFWQKINRIKGCPSNPVPLLQLNNNTAKSPLEKAQFLVKHYQQVSSNSNMSPETLKYQEDINLASERGGALWTNWLGCSMT